MADRHAAAVKAAATRKAKGEKTGFAKVSTAKRSSMAKKAAATRKARGIKSGFAKASSAKRSEMAKKAAATRKARGIKSGFARLTTAQRSANAKKSMATRKAKGEKIGFSKLSYAKPARTTPIKHRLHANHHPTFGNMTAAQKSARAKKAYATRLARSQGKVVAPTLKQANGKLHKKTAAKFQRPPTARQMNQARMPKRQTIKAVHARARSRYTAQRRMVI